MPDERGIIRIFQESLGNEGFVPEDVESFKLGGVRMFASMDTIVQSTDIPESMSLRDAARKSVVACVSDSAAKGIRPRYGIVSVNLPKRVRRATVRSIAEGMQEACNEYGIIMLGGDTNGGSEIVMSVALVGSSKSMVMRGGSSAGDAIFVTGPFGYAPAGLAMALGKTGGRGRFARKAKDAFARPVARLNFGVRLAKHASSSMDSSDGLAATLNEMARQSRKRFVVEALPEASGVREYAESHGMDPEEMIFYGGEEYEFVFTAPLESRKVISRCAVTTNTPIIEIGHVEPGAGVFRLDDGRALRVADRGWSHF